MHERVGIVWAVLLLLTLTSFIVGSDANTGVLATVIIIGLAAFKVRLVGVHFMDVRIAPLALRLVFEGYVAVVFAVLAGIAVFVR